MTPVGTSNELDVQNEWEENTHTHIVDNTDEGYMSSDDLENVNHGITNLESTGLDNAEGNNARVTSV